MQNSHNLQPHKKINMPKKRKKLNNAALFGVLVFLLSASSAYAQNGQYNIKLPNPALVPVSNSPLNTFVNLFNFVLGVAFGLAVLSIIISGVRYIVSYGNDEYMKKAKNNLFYAVLGLVIIILAYTIAATINAIFSA